MALFQTEQSFFKDECPHEFLGPGMKITSALVKQSNGKYKCKFCGKEFDEMQPLTDGSSYI